MASNRRLVLAGIVVFLGVLTGTILLEALGTILFALTVAYVLIPVHRWLVRRGLSQRMAAVAATMLGFAGVVAVFAPVFVTLYLRLEELEALVRSLPSEIELAVFDQQYVLEAGELQSVALVWLRDVAFAFASELPVLAIKFALFVILLFALLRKGEAAGRASIAPVPHEYRDVVQALAQRARETLYAIYVLQLATSVATLLIGYPLFWLLGYEMPFTLAMIAAILQFVPIIGPSLLIVPIAVYHVAVGEILAGVLVGVLGVALIAWFPDVGIRPYFAQRSANLPGSLYFIGFTGGLFTLGPIGIVVGPLIVAVFVEAVDQLAAEVNGDRTFSELAEMPTIQPTDGGSDVDEIVEPEPVTTSELDDDGSSTFGNSPFEPAASDSSDEPRS